MFNPVVKNCCMHLERGQRGNRQLRAGHFCDGIAVKLGRGEARNK
jgi:hypothetical protein